MEFPGSLEVTAMAQVRSLAQGLPRVKSLAKKKKKERKNDPLPIAPMDGFSTAGGGSVGTCCQGLPSPPV